MSPDLYLSFLLGASKRCALPNWNSPRLVFLAGSRPERWEYSSLYPAFRSRAKIYRGVLRFLNAIAPNARSLEPSAANTFVDFVSDVLPQTARTSVLIGTPGPAQKITVQIRDAQDAVIGYAKYGETEMAVKRVNHEFDILSRLPKSVGPEPLKVGEVLNGAMLVTTPVSGVPASVRLPPEKSVTDLLASLGLTERFAVDRHPWIVQLSDQFPRMRAWLDPLSKSDWKAISSHGDFVPWNLRQHNGHTAAIDWEYGCHKGFPFVDLAFYVLQTGALIYDWAPKRAVDAAVQFLVDSGTVTDGAAASSIVKLSALDAYRMAREDGHPDSYYLQTWRREVVGDVLDVGAARRVHPAPATDRPKVIATAYACEPFSGSEEGIGWNIVREVARHPVEMCVITRENNRPVIEKALAEDPQDNLSFVYFDYPKWSRWWKKGDRGLQLYYYMWQFGAYRLAKKLHAKHKFDLSHHVTFGRYWTPSFLPGLDIPFVWGPVGGGESAPEGFEADFGFRERAYEGMRSFARWMGERDPFVVRTIRRNAIALPTTRETEERLIRRGVDKSVVLGSVALGESDLATLSATAPPPGRPVRFVSVGRLLHWKGFGLGLRGFARSGLRDAEYWIIGDGPDRSRLVNLVQKLGLSSKVRFFGALSRAETLSRLAECSVLVHPSLHDSGGWVCIEAMAAGRPVICLNLGGPAIMVDTETGIKVDASNADDAVEGLASGMKALADDPEWARALGEKARQRAREHFTWDAKAIEIINAYNYALKEHQG